MNFEEIRAGQIIEHNKTYYTEWLFVLERKKNLIWTLKDTGDDIIERVIISKLVWDEDHRSDEILGNKEEASERRKDYIVFMWNSRL
jgi:hypothetical protein